MAKKVALLVIDIQKEFFKNTETKKSLENALEYINYTIGKFREANQPVVFVSDEEADQGVGSEGYELYEELDYNPEDIHISKKYCNSFWQTELEAKLREMGTEMVVICGFAAEYCVYGTYNGAMERGFEAVILQHGIASPNEKHKDMIENICKATSYAVLEYFLK